LFAKITESPYNTQFSPARYMAPTACLAPTACRSLPQGTWHRLRADCDFPWHRLRLSHILASRKRWSHHPLPGMDQGRTSRRTLPPNNLRHAGTCRLMLTNSESAHITANWHSTH